MAIHEIDQIIQDDFEEHQAFLNRILQENPHFKGDVVLGKSTKLNFAYKDYTHRMNVGCTGNKYLATYYFSPSKKQWILVYN